VKKEILKNYYKEILIIVLIIITLFQFQKGCFSLPEEGRIDTVIKIETKWDTIIKTTQVYIPKWDTIVKEIFIKEPIDTPEIIKDYFSKYYYVDIIDLDSLGFIIVKDTISQNKIHSRQVTSNLNIPTTTITQTITKTSYINRRELYIGMGLGFNRERLNHISGEILYRSKKPQIYSLGLGINPEFDPIIMGRIFWRINK